MNNRSSIQSSGRLGRPYSVQYVNKAGQLVNPHTGKVLNKNAAKTQQNSSKPYARPIAKENSNSHGSSGSSKRSRLPVKKAGMMFGDLDPIPTDPTIDPPPRVCFNCWQPDHKRRDCPRPVNHTFCNNCGRRGEDLRSCPRCSRAHRRYLQLLQAKERGEDVDEQLFCDGLENDSEDIDEVLQELIYQDQKNRELYAHRMREEQHQLDGPDSYVERELYSAGKRESFRHSPEVRANDRDSYGVQRESSAKYANEWEDSSAREDSLRESTQERRMAGGLAYREHDQHRFEAERASSRIPEHELYYTRKDLARRSPTPSPPPPPKSVSASKMDNQTWRSAVADASSSSGDSDPVQDILLLAKSISHLSPETQDLIMRQVIAERQEQARRRAAAQEYGNHAWP